MRGRKPVRSSWGTSQTEAMACWAVWVTPCAPYNNPSRPTIRPSELPCRRLRLAGLKLSPTTGN
jgi:hypothetical protein